MEKRAIRIRCKSQILKEDVGNKRVDAVCPVIRITKRTPTPIHISNYAANVSRIKQNLKIIFKMRGKIQMFK